MPVEPFRIGAEARVAAHRRFRTARQHLPCHVLERHSGFVGAQAGEVNGAGIGRSSGDDQFWPVPESQIANVVEIDAFGLLVNAVGRDFVVATRQRRGMAVADVASGGDIHRKNRVAELQ